MSSSRCGIGSLIRCIECRWSKGEAIKEGVKDTKYRREQRCGNEKGIGVLEYNETAQSGSMGGERKLRENWRRGEELVKCFFEL